MEPVTQVLDQRVLGSIVLMLWAVLAAVKKRDKPQGGVWLWLIHVFNSSW